MEQNKIEKYEKLRMVSKWKGDTKAIAYEVFRAMLPIAFYYTEETAFLEFLLDEGVAYLSEQIKCAYKYLDEKCTCPFEEKDFDLTVIEDERGGVYTVRVEILNKADWTEVRRIYIQFMLHEEDVYNRSWSFSMEDEAGELTCYSVEENGYLDCIGIIDEEEPDLLEAEYECTMFEYFCKHHM